MARQRHSDPPTDNAVDDDQSERNENDGVIEEEGSDERDGGNNEDQDKKQGGDEGEDDDDDEDEEEEEEDDDDLLIELVYDLKGIPELQELDGDRQDFEVSKREPYQNFFNYLADYVGDTLAGTHEIQEFYSLFRQARNQHYILLRPELQHPCPVKRRAFAFDDSGVTRLSEIGDLLGEAEDTSEGEPDLVITLHLVEPLAVSDDEEPLVVIRSGAKTKDLGGLSQFYRIGHVPGKAAKSRLIPTSEAFFWKLSIDSGDVTRVRAPAWTLCDLSVCNPDEGKPASSHSVNTARSEALMRGYDKGEVSKDYSKFAEQLKDGSAPLLMDGRLLYSFKTFGTEGKSCPNPIDAVPSTGISLALRFINHLEGEEASKLSFSDTVELLLGEKDNYDTICHEIRKRFVGRVHRNTNALVRGSLFGRFDIELWVLLQIPDGKILFKFKKDVHELYEFLNEPEDDDADATLFMEVHLVPKPAPEIQRSRSGRVIKSVQKV